MNTAPNTEVRKEIQNLLSERMNRYGFERAEIEAGEDHSGDPALFIDAYYHLSDVPLETMVIIRLLTEIRNILVHMGDRRFPHLRHHFDEKQPVAPRKRAKK